MKLFRGGSLVAVCLFIVLGGIGLAILTAKSFPGSEQRIASQCLIEDCPVSRHSGGFPLRATQTVRYSGLNCSSEMAAFRDSKCDQVIGNVPNMIGNAAFYASICLVLVGVYSRLRSNSAHTDEPSVGPYNPE